MPVNPQSKDILLRESFIKKMCLDTHATPCEEKTLIHKCILINRRNPYSSAHTKSEADIKSNPRIDDYVDVWFDHLCTHLQPWPKGVRKDSNRPFMSDLIVNRAIARMRPTESASVRNDFVAQSHRYVFQSWNVPSAAKEELHRRLSDLLPCFRWTYYSSQCGIAFCQIWSHAFYGNEEF